MNLFSHSHSVDQLQFHFCQDASETIEKYPLHWTWELPVLASAHPKGNSPVYIWTNTDVFERESVHHGWVQSTPAVEALSKKVSRGWHNLISDWITKTPQGVARELPLQATHIPSNQFAYLPLSLKLVYSCSPMRLWTFGVTCWGSSYSSHWEWMICPRCYQPQEPPGRTMSSTQ